MSTVVKIWQFCWTSWKLNLAGAMEFRVSFLLTAGMMMINNLVWIFFWGVYFYRFPIVKGWSFTDIMMMWSIATTGFGIAAVFFGNFSRIANIVATGDLDTYLAQPKPVLLNVLVSRMSVSAIGDLLFGLLLFAYFGDHTMLGFMKFILAILVATLFFLFFNVLTQSLAFFIGNAEGLGYQLFMIFLTFSMYPTDIFRGWGRVILFTVVPAGFISFLPIGLLRGVDASFLWLALGAAMLLTLGGSGLFYLGLRRYSSGNRIGVRM